MITQFGLMLVLILFSLVFKMSRSNKDNKLFDDDDGKVVKTITYIFILGFYFLFYWLVSGYLLPYVHKYIPV